MAETLWGFPILTLIQLSSAPILEAYDIMTRNNESHWVGPSMLGNETRTNRQTNTLELELELKQTGSN